jgi:hypothetical protein
MAEQNRKRRAAFGSLAILTVSLTIALSGGQGPKDSTAVQINGVKSEYASCALVSFSVKNTSEEDIYFEVYAEKFESDAWKDVDFTYDLRDPKSRYIKRVLSHPDPLKAGGTQQLDWDRCLRPRFVKETDEGYRRAISGKDAKSKSPILERLRVDVYLLDNGHLTSSIPDRRAYSKAFRRIPGHTDDPYP